MRISCSGNKSRHLLPARFRNRACQAGLDPPVRCAFEPSSATLSPPIAQSPPLLPHPPRQAQPSRPQPPALDRHQHHRCRQRATARKATYGVARVKEDQAAFAGSQGASAGSRLLSYFATHGAGLNRAQAFLISSSPVFRSPGRPLRHGVEPKPWFVAFYAPSLLTCARRHLSARYQHSPAHTSTTTSLNGPPMQSALAPPRAYRLPP